MFAITFDSCWRFEIHNIQPPVSLSILSMRLMSYCVSSWQKAWERAFIAFCSVKGETQKCRESSERHTRSLSLCFDSFLFLRATLGTTFSCLHADVVDSPFLLCATENLSFGSVSLLVKYFRFKRRKMSQWWLSDLPGVAVFNPHRQKLQNFLLFCSFYFSYKGRNVFLKSWGIFPSIKMLFLLRKNSHFSTMTPSIWRLHVEGHFIILNTFKRTQYVMFVYLLFKSIRLGFL